MKMHQFVTTALVFFLATSSLLAQDSSPDFLRSIGKMYVVVAVIVAVFLGIILFLVFLDRRLTKIENQIKNHG